MARSTDETTLKSASNGELSKTDKEVNSNSPDHLQQTDNGIKNEPFDVGPTESKSQEEWITGIPLIMITAGMTLVTLLFMLDVSIISTATPRITDEFHSLEDIGWYASAYTISSAALQPLNGKLFKHFKLKWTYLSFFMVFELGSLICGVAVSSKMFIIGRAVAGIGCAGLLNGGLIITAASVPMQSRPVLIGIIMGVAQLGFVSGPLIGGAFTIYTTWRWCFYVNLPIGGAVAVLLLFTRIPEQMPKKPFLEVIRTLSLVRDFDIIGLFFFSGASIQLLLGLEYGGNQYAWNSAVVIGLLCGGAATFVVFGVWENHMGENAMLPGRLVKQRAVWSSSMMFMMIFGVTVPSLYYIPIYFQAILNKSALGSGVDMLPTVLGQLVSAVLSGVLTSTLGYYLPWGVAGSIITAASNGLLATLSTSTSIPKWAAYLVLSGFGRGLAFQVPMVAVQNSVPPTDLAAAMAILTCFQTFGGAISVSVAQAIFTQGLRTNIPKDAPAVNVDAVIEAGVTAFRTIVPSSELPAVLTAYAKSINWVFYLVASLSVLQFVFSWGVGWKSVKTKKEDKKEETNKV